MDDFEALAENPEAELGGFDRPDDIEGAVQEQSTEPEVEATEEASPEEHPVEQQDPWKALIYEGETEGQALLRLEESRRQNEGRAAAHWAEIKDMKETLKRVTKENAAAQKILDMLNAAQEESDKAAAAAAEPDPDLDPEAWQRHQIQKQQEKLDRVEQLILERQKAEEEKALADESSSQLKEMDGRNFTEVNSLLGLDGNESSPEFEEDWNLVFNVTYESLRQMYPTATPEQLLEAFNGVLVLQGRQAAAQGGSLARLVQERAKSFRGAVGAQRRTEGDGSSVTNRAPTPAEISAAAEREKKSRGVRRIPGGSGGKATTSSLSDFAALDEEEQVKLLSSGKSKFDSEDIWASLAAEINS